jgi:hypothetical protein
MKFDRNPECCFKVQSSATAYLLTKKVRKGDSIGLQLIAKGDRIELWDWKSRRAVVQSKAEILLSRDSELDELNPTLVFNI